MGRRISHGGNPSFFARVRNQTAVRAVLKAERREAHGGTLAGTGGPGGAVRRDALPAGLRPHWLPGGRGGRDAGVFVRLLRARPEFRDEEHAKAWLLRVGARCAADVLRAPWRRREGPLDDALSAPEPVLALPAQYRMAVHLYYYEELSVAEIAAVLGKSEGAVKSRLFRARALLRRYLKEDGDVSERL